MRTLQSCNAFALCGLWRESGSRTVDCAMNCAATVCACCYCCAVRVPDCSFAPVAAVYGCTIQLPGFQTAGFVAALWLRHSGARFPDRRCRSGAIYRANRQPHGRLRTNCAATVGACCYCCAVRVADCPVSPVAAMIWLRHSAARFPAAGGVAARFIARIRQPHRSRLRHELRRDGLCVLLLLCQPDGRLFIRTGCSGVIAAPFRCPVYRPQVA